MFPSGSKILLVDDSSFARTLIKNSLKELKFSKIIEADSAKAAKGVLTEAEQLQDPVHLMILDLHMPSMSGADLVRWVRGRYVLKALPIIIVTSSQEKKEVLEVGKLGVSHYMLKPTDTATIRDRLVSTWEKHGRVYYESFKNPKDTPEDP